MTVSLQQYVELYRYKIYRSRLILDHRAVTAVTMQIQQMDSMQLIVSIRFFYNTGTYIVYHYIFTYLSSSNQKSPSEHSYTASTIIIIIAVTVTLYSKISRLIYVCVIMAKRESKIFNVGEKGSCSVNYYV